MGRFTLNLKDSRNQESEELVGRSQIGNLPQVGDILFETINLVT